MTCCTISATALRRGTRPSPAAFSASASISQDSSAPTSAWANRSGAWLAPPTPPGSDPALVDLKLHCINPQTDGTFAPRLQETNPHPVNVFHLDAPVSGDIDHHHGPAFRSGKYNIGYWAWELPEFPDAWINYARYFDEIWTPSRFSAEAIAASSRCRCSPCRTRSRLRVRPGTSRRSRLPRGQVSLPLPLRPELLLERKNPAAVIEAFRRSGPRRTRRRAGGEGSQCTGQPVRLRAGLQATVNTVPGTTLITPDADPREIYELQSALRLASFAASLGRLRPRDRRVHVPRQAGHHDGLVRQHRLCARGQLLSRALRPRDARSHARPVHQGQTWASPDIDHAASWMRQLVGESPAGRHKSALPRASASNRSSPPRWSERVTAAGSRRSPPGNRL